MNYFCSLHCGHFSGVDPETFSREEKKLTTLFKFVGFDAERHSLELTGAQNVDHDPAKLTEIFDTLAGLLSDQGKGRIMLQCDAAEICFFRKDKWKLMAVQIPEDPFDGVHYVE